MNIKTKILVDSISKVIVGKEETIKKVIISLLCGGHVLLEDVPGVGKTQLVTALSRSVGGKFNRIQLTPDIMPSDIVGFSIVDKSGSLVYREGVAMCNFLLADEINRASPKVQSALLEVMEEYQISVDGQTHRLPEPFMVMATQNPIETYGTYHLPEAQMDRFFMKLSMGYPECSEEIKILERTEFDNPIKNIADTVLTGDDIIQMQSEVKKIRTSPEIKEYIVRIAGMTRNDPNLSLGVSPRGSIALHKGSKASAYMHEREYVIPDDVKNIAVSVLSHRIILSPQGKNNFHTAENYISELLKKAEIPV
ncbi:MAG: MoxR family ATPase [Oscillospiraceae bacterium]|nr:MoxR family ATPase [Oscillospiraceae bacterium]